MFRKTIIGSVLLLTISGCGSVFQFLTCGDGPCPEYKVCPVEHKKVKIETIRRTESIDVKCGWFKNFVCAEWEETYQDEQGHVWKEMDSVKIPQ